jgi:hypothetical protein
MMAVLSLAGKNADGNWLDFPEEGRAIGMSNR